MTPAVAPEACVEGEGAFLVLLLADEATETELRSVLGESGPQAAALRLKRFEDPEALAAAASNPEVALAIVDEEAPELRAGDLVARIRAACPRCETAVISDRVGLAADVELIRSGAAALLRRPFWSESLKRLIGELAERRASRREGDALLGSSSERFGAIISHGPEMEKVLSIAARAAASDATVLIRGESGTGKELIARAIHAHGPRRARPFVPVNIAALSENLIESELFGHAKGSFTGAVADREGRFDHANGGCLFIDEVGDVPPGIQVKLLRVLQFGTFERVGENRSRAVDVRIIAATNRNLQREVREGRFRADLYYRLDVIPLRVPPLREHKQDVPYLVEHFLKAFALKNGKPIKGIAAEAMARIMRHPFHGNVRELENFMERGIVLCRGEYLTETDVFLLEDEAEDAIETGAGERASAQSEAGAGYEQALAAFERDLLRAALKRNGANRSAAARELGIGERRLRYRLSSLGIE